MRAALDALAGNLVAHCGGRATARANFHATLAFLGAVPRERYEAFVELAAGVEAAAFDLTLDSVSHWRHNHIVWAGTRATPPALAALAADLGQRLAALPWPVDERPYTPHVTLVRDARRAPPVRVVEVPCWRVREFALVSSTSHDGGVRYTPLARWPLAPA